MGWPLVALRIALLALDGITLAEVTPVRERLGALGAEVTLLVPGGGSILPISGRYFPAAGGQGLRRALAQTSPGDFDLLLLPDALSDACLRQHPDAIQFLRGSAHDALAPLLTFQVSYLLHLLDCGVDLSGIALAEDLACSAG